MNKEEFISFVKSKISLTMEDYAKLAMIKDSSCKKANARLGAPGVIIIEIYGGNPERIKNELEEYRPLGIEINVRQMEI